LIHIFEGQESEHIPRESPFIFSHWLDASDQSLNIVSFSESSSTSQRVGGLRFGKP
jgi:hypothetical protein